MLHIQNMLLQYGLDHVVDQLAIKVTTNDYDDRMILNYNQIESPKTHPAVMEARGLTLNKNDFSLIAKGMTRFFNVGEALQITDKFEWNQPFKSFEKVDGSLVHLFWYDGDWRVQTRGSFAQSQICDGCPYTWERLFWDIFPKSELWRSFDKNITFVFEMCSQWNKVVRTYPEPQLFLLNAYNSGSRMIDGYCDERAKSFKVKRPIQYKFKNFDGCTAHIRAIEKDDPTDEGLVLEDINNLRLKIKSDTYKALSRLKENGNIFLVKNMVPLVLSGEIGNKLEYFPEAEERALEIRERIDIIKGELDDLWFTYKDLEIKKFAKTVKDHPFSFLLFYAKNRNLELKQSFADNHDNFVKKLICYLNGEKSIQTRKY